MLTHRRSTAGRHDLMTRLRDHLRSAEAVGLAAILAVAVLLGSALLAASAGTASASPTISGDQAEISQLAQEIAQENVHLHQLSFAYDQAQYEEQQIHAQLVATRAKLAATEAEAATTLAHLRNTAINAYVEQGSNLGNLGLLLTSQASSYGLRTEYLNVAQGHLTEDIAAYHQVQLTLSGEETQLSQEKAQAQAKLVTIANDRAAAQATVAQEQAVENQVQGNLQQLQAAAQAAERRMAQAAAARQAAQAAAARAAAAQAVAAQAVAAQTASQQGGGGAPVQPLPPPSTSWQQQADTAVHAALSQVGTPYVWGGDTPSQGFDCSGLVKWAWGQAGVYLPHYSVAQWDSVAQVPASNLQPGDIVFYYSPYESAQPGHEALYIGNGEVVQAPETGMDVMVTSLTWAGQPMGYGQPS